MRSYDQWHKCESLPVFVILVSICTFACCTIALVLDGCFAYTLFWPSLRSTDIGTGREGKTSNIQKAKRKYRKICERLSKTRWHFCIQNDWTTRGDIVEFKTVETALRIFFKRQSQWKTVHIE